MERNFNNDNWDTIKNKLQEFCKSHTIEVQGNNNRQEDFYWNKLEQITGKTKNEIKNQMNRFY